MTEERLKEIELQADRLSERELIIAVRSLRSLLREALEMISSHEQLCGCVEQEECIKRIAKALAGAGEDASPTIDAALGEE